MKIGEFCEVVRGSSPRPQGDPRYYGGNVPRLMVADVTRDGQYVTPKIDFLTEDGAKLSRPMKAGDVIIAVSGNPGQPAILNIDACIHDGFVGLKDLDRNVDSAYLYYALLQIKTKSKSQAVGAIFKNLTTDQIKAIDIFLPPLPKQKRIAAILDKADAVRRKRQETIRLLDEFLRSMFLEMFGDPVRNEKGWDTDTVGGLISQKVILEIQDGNHGEVHPKVEDYVNEGIPFVAAAHLRNNKLNLQNTPKLSQETVMKLRVGFSKAGDVLLTHKGSIGNTAIVPNDIDLLILTPQVTYYRIDKNKLNPLYLTEYFKTQYFQSQLVKFSKQSTRDYIGISRQRELKLVLPPIMLQKEFSFIVNQVKNLKDKYLNSIEKSNDYFNSLMQDCFKKNL